MKVLGFMTGTSLDGVDMAVLDTDGEAQLSHGPWAEKPMPRVFVYATGWDATPFAPQYERLRDDQAWQVHTLACGHDVVRERPDEIFAILTQMASDLSSG